MLRPYHKGKNLPVGQWDGLVMKIEASEWGFGCGEHSLVVAKLFNVKPWQVGPLGYFHDADDWLGSGMLGWVPISEDATTTQPLPDDCEVIVVTKEGAEVARKKVEDFSYEELLKYCTLHLWILPENEVWSLTSWKFPQDELLEVQKALAGATWRLTDETVNKLEQDSRFDTNAGTVGLLRPAVGKVEVGQESFLHLATLHVTAPLDARPFSFIDSDNVFYILDSSRALIDSFRATEITLDLFRKYASNYVWVSASWASPERIAAYDAEVAKHRNK